MANEDMKLVIDTKPPLSSLPERTTPTSSTSMEVDVVGEDVKPNLKLLQQIAMKKYAGSNSSSSIKGKNSAVQESYAIKLKRLKGSIKEYIFINGAICDEVQRTEEKLARVKEERRFLLRKLLQFQSISDPTGNNAHKADTPAAMVRSLKAAYESSLNKEAPPPTTKGGKGVKRKLTVTPTPPAISVAGGSGNNATSSVPSASGAGTGSEGRKKKGHQASKNGTDAVQSQGRPKKSKSAGKKSIPPLMLDSLGRPMIPMMLGEITLHSMGEIVSDRPSFHCQDAIYPAGYCITRVFVSLRPPDTRCLYTCKISEGEDEPLFEIAPEDNSDLVFKANTPVECHRLLLRAINDARSTEIVPTNTNGLDFFGLSHSVIQNLIQSIPGARKCCKYKWVKFEIDKSQSNANYAVGKNDPTISYEAFMNHRNSFV